ncbi:hypothetical protein MJD09_10675 [bacterium]|nr:hypothetical protein [bacterium]
MRSKRAVQDVHLSALETLLANDPEYAALYEHVSNLLNDAEAATEAALAQAETDLGDAEAALEETMENANRLPDGTAVFRDKDGNIRTEDGRIIEGEEAESIVWKDDAPSYEDYLQRKQEIEDLRQRIEELRRYLIDVIGDARDRINDPDNPPTKEELERIEREIREKAPEAVRAATDIEAPETDHPKAASHEIEVLKF